MNVLITIILVGIIVFLLDFSSKAIVLAVLEPHSSIVVLPHVLYLTLVRNTGIAFGLFKGNAHIASLLVLIGCLLLVCVLYSMKTHSRGTDLCCGLILGGAVGNLVDRIRFGAVIDFIDVRVWPVFNIADMCISIAAGLFIIILLKQK